VILSPTGYITWISGAYPGRITDADIVQHCGFLDRIEKGDVYAADKGVLISNELEERGSSLVMPPRKLTHQPQFSADAAYETSEQANVRVHVERAMARLKTFGYLQVRRRLTTLTNFSLALKAIALLVNFQGEPIGPSLGQPADFGKQSPPDVADYAMP
jgi:hypothetical protein